MTPITSEFSEMPFPDTLSTFQRMFSTEDKCFEYLRRLRWPHTFACDRCDWKGDPARIETRPELFRCRSCKADISLTAGTVMHRSKMPLTMWFAAAYLVATQTPGESAVQFQRQLGLGRYETAFQLLHKLRAAMIRPDQDRIGGEWAVEVDETYVGGVTKGEGHGVHHKTLVIGAVEVRPSEKPTHGGKRTVKAGRLRLRVIGSRGRDELEAFVKESVLVDSRVTTDGWQGYDHVAEAGYKHTAVVLDGDPEATEKALPMIHIVFGNLKTWILGTHHGVSPQHLQAYLNEFTFRFNRRHHPQAAFRSLLGVSTRRKGPTYNGLYKGTYEHSRQAVGE